ncbi:DEAD/DEAH box helicase [Pedobacter africanus]|uniref:Helicase conserved C-terminal domain-containing protein n=1 Tax=Pedobacter africanus TaxID=151894 RepID=A0A1W2CR38_9SPHI|nr:DEAD/DEAH box helicase [Pedobacter africanus]SMC87663.1 Helicase conserved C-terminal domain-containing protein [Pedobacter africanus]
MKRKLYHYQESDVELLFNKLEQRPFNHRLLYQLPTGGGKTVVFSEIAMKFIKKYNKKVIVLTHRKELCDQTSAAVKLSGISTKVIDSSVKKIARREGYACYVAMVETLKNRINDKLVNVDDVGLVIVDEAHHNSFHKLLGKFKNASVIGVTATPFSSDVNLPMRRNYNELVVGAPICSLIESGYLARPFTWKYDVELNTLKTGIHGDFTVSTSDELYSSKPMLDLLVHAYERHSKNKKTLIFNNGIFTSRKVEEVFSALGYPIRHLDNKTSPAERKEILQWLKKTRGAILTSVSILTTGFDEPTIQTVILNRATTSITLYHQMIGRGSRRLPQKKTFSIIDLGNNTERFGEWAAPIDWQHVFENPETYHEMLNSRTSYQAHQIPSDMRDKFPASREISFDVQAAHQAALESGKKARVVIRDSIRQHALMCVDNSDSIIQALELTAELNKEIDWRIKQYGKCLGKVTKNYTDWLKEDYMVKLKKLIEKIMGRRVLLKAAV